MKKLWIIALCALVATALSAGGAKDQNAGELVVYGSCEEEHVAAICAKFNLSKTFHRRSFYENRRRKRQPVGRRVVRRYNRPV